MTLSPKIWALCLLLAMLVLGGCEDRDPVMHGPIATPTATPSGPSQSVEDELAQEAAARLKASIADYQVKLATSAQEKVVLKADAQAQHAQVNALVKMGAEQRVLDLQALFDRFYFTSAFLCLIDAVLIYWAITKASKRAMAYAGIVSVLAGTCAALPSIFHGIITHEALIRFGFSAVALGLLVHHYEAQLKEEAAKACAEAKVLALALEHAAKLALTDMENHAGFVYHLVPEVETALEAVYRKVTSAAHALAVDLHLTKAVAPSAPLASLPVAGKGEA